MMYPNVGLDQKTLYLLVGLLTGYPDPQMDRFEIDKLEGIVLSARAAVREYLFHYGISLPDSINKTQPPVESHENV